MKLTASKWLEILIQCDVRAITASKWAPIFAEVVGDSTFSGGDLEVDDFIGQVLHESGHLERLEEGLSYSAERLMAVWPKRFPTLESATPFARNPAALANKVYGGRMGNTEAGDGFKFRGRGLLQVTGRYNYDTVGAAMGLDLIANPDMLAHPETALRSAIAWWEGGIPDSALGNIVKVTKLVNGGTTGLDDRQKLTDAAREALS